MAWAGEMAELVRSTGLPVSLWQGQWGTEPGSIVWSAPIESIAQMADFNQAIVGNQGYLDLLAKGVEAQYIADFQPDRVVQLIHGDITEPAPIGCFVGAVNAVATDGRWSEAGAWAVKIAEMWGGLTGISPIVTTTIAGSMGEFSWLARHDDAASIDASVGKVMASTEYAAELDAAGGLFRPGVTQVYVQRVA